MIGKVTRGSDTGGLLRYLYGPGRANEHTDPRLVASWTGDDRDALDPLEPGGGATPGRRDVAELAARLSLPLQLVPDGVDRHVWQCSMRTADGDRHLTDAEWATVARDVVDRTGFAPAGDPGGCRWVAVRHADDHIHIVVVLARQDGDPVRVFRDWPKVHEAARAAERRYGLVKVPSPDRTAEVDVSRAKSEKASRVGAKEPARRWLTRQVRVAVAGSTSREVFAQALEQAGVLVTWRESVKTPGQITGYAVGRPADVDADGRQIWFSGSKLSPDLSLPKLRARWQEVDGRRQPRRPGLTHEQRRQVLDRAARAMGAAADKPVISSAAVSAAEVATVIAAAVEGADGGPLTDAARHLARAARLPGGRRPDTGRQVHVLRSVATNIAALGDILPGETGHALLIIAHLARLTAALTHHGDERPHQATRRACRALEQFAGPVTQPQVEVLASALDPLSAAAISRDPAWPALAALLRTVEASGLNPKDQLQQAAAVRDLGTARSRAAVLHHRLLIVMGDRPAGVWPPAPLRGVAAWRRCQPGGVLSEAPTLNTLHHLCCNRSRAGHAWQRRT